MDEGVSPAASVGPEVTRTECKRCGKQIRGVNGRYACSLCGWVNHWSEGHNRLPSGAEDPDYRPGRS
ncbi:hypothetical protein [Streptomyces sp. t39]|uniref:hypothetical protein n=1 Tax=Streptomyces sp. t39 TaxID=1828156 RepID=UPI0011CE01E9|nr:hypothetical protein [Streptomyces sp. t39]TXS57986.1 hypothetical protein EAO77_17465 [Streptomyces sp. t39]